MLKKVSSKLSCKNPRIKFQKTNRFFVCSGKLESIQANVDQLSLGNYSNLAQWVDKLDQAVSFISYAIFCE